MFHTIVVHDQRMCHDMTQGQGHITHGARINARDIDPNCYVGSGLYFTKLLSMTQEWTSRFSYVKIIGAHVAKIHARGIITFHC